MDRETKTLTLPASGIAVVVNSDLFGFENRALARVFIGKSLNMSLEGGVSGIDADTVETAQEAAWKIVVVSIDGHKEGDVIEGVDTPFSIVDAILHLKSQDYNFVLNTVNEITNDANDIKKNQS